MKNMSNATPIEEIETALKACTIFDKIEFSGISKKAIKDKIKDLRERQVPNREVLLETDDEDVAEYWFKNWLHPMLKHAVRPSPKNKVGCSSRVLEVDARRDALHFFENGQQNFKYSLADVEKYCEEA